MQRNTGIAHVYEGRDPNSMRIFISYGHDEHASLAQRISDDLKLRGHQTWFDLERLRPGGDWERYIEEGLDWVSQEPASGRIVLIMTPHSVRRPDGYCLNELARAIMRRVPIVPVMAVWCEPPLSIARIQWLDVTDCIPVDQHTARYEQRLQMLLEALESPEPNYEGAQARLISLLEPLRYDNELTEHVLRFQGRDWVFERIDRWLADPNASRVFWIRGQPGVGKTALAAWLCDKRPEVAAFHFCRHRHTLKSDPRRAVLSIAYQLSTQLRNYRDQLNALDIGPDTIRAANAQTLFDILILLPLTGAPPPDRKVVVLIDALDEATEDGRNELAAFIATEWDRTPQWLRLIVTARPDPEVAQPLQRFEPCVLDPAEPDNLRDIRNYVRREFACYAGGSPPCETVVDKIVERSEGVFLYVEYLRRAIG